MQDKGTRDRHRIGQTLDSTELDEGETGQTQSRSRQARLGFHDRMDAVQNGAGQVKGWTTGGDVSREEHHLWLFNRIRKPEGFRFYRDM